MIEKYNPRKRWYKCLAMVLVIAMSVSLLSGCGQKGTETQTDPAAQTEQAAGQKVVEDGVQSAASTLAKRSEETEDLLEQLGRAAEKEDAGEMHTLAHALSDKLTETKEDTKQWLAAQQEMAKDLSGDAAKTLEERQKVFEQELEAGEKEAEETLNKLGEALEKGDMEEVSAEAARLQELLVKKEEPKTYGDTLPGEVPVNEAEEQAYEEEKPEDTKAQETSEDSDNAAAISLSADEEQKLLVTEGDTALNERIKQKAEELGTPLAVYNYLKNNIGYEYYYGSRKGAAGTLDAMGGNDLDQASLLIAMLRHLGYPAQYVRGDILLTEEQALSLTGADTFRQAADVLAANGTPVTRLTRGEEIVYIRMEHVWVRAYIPYTDYRGAGNAGGDSLWIDLDTGIKAYEAADNIYDTLEEQGFSEEAETAARAGNVEQMESLLEQWQEKLESQDLSETYARKRIIRQEELSYLPLSLQYSVEKESRTFEQVADTEKDRVSFEVNGEVLAGFAASELQGKNILLSFRPASGADQAIYDSYGSIFDVPAYAVYMKPVLLIDNEVAAEGESYLESTLGTKGSLTINLTSGGRNASVSNDITTGSMYAVTLDSQTITAEELQSVYDEAAALKDSVTEDNVYSEGYLGKLLALAGKLYFVQVDIADTMAADMYDVVSTRSLSEGITGYEVRTSSLYGRITSLSEGSLYIDVDTDSHGVVSLDGEEDVTREYMSSTGMMSSLYESTVWEELTGYESVSTISILAKAQEENVEVLLLSSLNMDTELEKLNTDEATRQTVINAVNSGKVVTIPAEEITIGNWTGTGYIVTNPETGAGEYMISGGLNGGSTKFILGLEELLTTVGSAVALAGLIVALAGALSGFLLVGCVALLLAAWFVVNYLMWTNYMEYAFNDNPEAKEISEAELAILIIYTIILQVVVIPYVPQENQKPGGEEGDIGTNAASRYGIDIDNLNFSDTVQNHTGRPYQDYKSLINEIIESKPPIADPQGTSALYWEVDGSFNGSNGIYELLIDPESNTVWHFLFRKY